MGLKLHHGPMYLHETMNQQSDFSLLHSKPSALTITSLTDWTTMNPASPQTVEKC